MSTATEIRDGLTLILAREPDTEVDIHNDTLYAGNAASDVYTDADRAALEALGWVEDEESWAVNT